jgi:hypothetical protein
MVGLRRVLDHRLIAAAILAIHLFSRHCSIVPLPFHELRYAAF